MNQATSARFFWKLLLFWSVAWCGACANKVPVEKLNGNSRADRVLVVINKNSSAGEKIGEYYMQQRHIPPTNIVRIDVRDDDEIGDLEFRARIIAPIRDAIAALPVRIDFIVLTKGVPLRLDNSRGYSVDATIAGMDLPIPPMVGMDTVWMRRYHNPYFHTNEPFNSEKFGMFLVTRLDCNIVSDCIALVDRSLAAQPVRGPFFLDAAAPNGSDDGYRITNLEFYAAAKRLREVGADVTLDSTSKFVAPPGPVMGYASWGSNDSHFDSVAYHSIRFLPGALAETFVSTSARTFKPTTGGQSKIVDLIAQGVTGVKGYVSEPYTIAMADPLILFDHYLRGFTLAESFYAASRMVLWKDIVVGDPLCAPYANTGPQ
jgi:uncharacterized protein (TIGR03790 family)